MYSWDAVTDQYEQLLTAVCDAHGPGALPDALVDREPVGRAVRAGVGGAVAR